MNYLKANMINWAGLALLPAAMLGFTSCSSTPKLEPTTTPAYEQGVPGGVFVETYKNSATVTAIDTANRKVTLVTPDGRKDTFTAGPEVINFDQIRVGDQVKATLTQQLAVSMAPEGAPLSDGGAAAVVLAPKGAKPGGIVANTVLVTATVKAIDLKHHKATLEFPDGTTKTFAVRRDVDLAHRHVGEKVSLRTTETLAISVEKP